MTSKLSPSLLTLAFLSRTLSPVAAAPLEPDSNFDMNAIQATADTFGGPGSLTVGAKEDPGPARAVTGAPALSGFTPSKEWREVTQEGEATFLPRIKEIINGMQRQAAEQGDGTIRRGFHAKGHGGLTATFKVLDGIPEFARQGLFKEPRTYQAWIRFSNGQGIMGGDKGADVRGLAVKVFGVDGPKLLPGQETARTQDFLTTNFPSTGVFKSPEQFLTFASLTLGSRALLPVRLVRAVGASDALRILKFVATRLTKKIGSLAAETYFSGAPIKFGPYAAKFEFRPGKAIDASRPWFAPADYLRKDFQERLAKDDISFDFVAQFYVNDAATPIEDGSVTWDATVSPPIKLGELTIARRDLSSATVHAVEAQVETFSFNPWHGLVEHQPLGHFMRARRIAYTVSPELRGAAAEPEQFSTR